MRLIRGGLSTDAIAWEDVADGMEFLELLKSRVARPEVRNAISMASRQLKKAEGQTVEAALKNLAKSNPQKPRSNRSRRFLDLVLSFDGLPFLSFVLPSRTPKGHNASRCAFHKVEKGDFLTLTE